MPQAFLIQQMEWREALDDASGLADLERLSDQVDQARRDAMLSCEHLIDEAHEYGQAVGQVRAMMFIERFSQEVNVRLDACHDAMDTASKGQ